MRLRSGFSLIEMSIVLMVLGIILASLLPKNQVDKQLAQANLTLARMTRIEEALAAYKASSAKLPCPAPVNVAMFNNQFGVAANYVTGTPGTCKNSAAPDAVSEKTTSPNASFGIVPTRTLGLPDDYAFDGYGRLLSYHVSLASVKDGSAGGLVVKNAAGSNLTTTAAYVIISHGKDGHGAYLVGGQRFSNGNTNASTQQNCDCDSSAVEKTSPDAYANNGNVFVKDISTGADLTRFDNIVRYGNMP